MLVGVIVHGERTYGFGCTTNCKLGTNLAILGIHRALLNQFQLHGKLPKQLFLQLDNTGNQNKNRCMVAYCALLIHCGMFEKVQISFLPVGHTHEDIDRIFSYVHKRLRQNDLASRLGWEIFAFAMHLKLGER